MGYQYKVVIAGVEYGMSDIASVKIEHPLFDKLSVGNTCSAELDITFWPKSDIPKMAKIIPYVWGEELGYRKDVSIELKGGFSGIAAGTYSVDVPGIGKYAVVFPTKAGSSSRVRINASANGSATATLERYSWFETQLLPPEDLEIYAAPDNTYPDLFPLACTHETPQPGCESGGCSQNPVLITTTDTEEKAWYQLGVFYTDTRARTGDMLNIIAYDEMIKSDIIWVPDQELEFPMSMPDAVAKIRQVMGVELDGRTVLNSAYTIDYPANDYTLRDVLGFIGAAHAGNWIFTSDGKLLLVPLFASMPEETSYLITEDGDPILIGGVHITV